MRDDDVEIMTAPDKVTAETESDQETESTQEAEESQQAAPLSPAEKMRVIEAVLFAAAEPVSPLRLQETLGKRKTSLNEVRELVALLQEEYTDQGRAFRIKEVAGGIQMSTEPQFFPYLRKLFKMQAEGKLSPAAVETLAIIAYKQPLIRSDIENIRGVGAGPIVRTLLEKELVKIVGRAQQAGNPLLYGTTKKFLRHFGLKSLKELPKMSEVGEMNLDNLFQSKTMDGSDVNEGIDDVEKTEEELETETDLEETEKISEANDGNDEFLDDEDEFDEDDE